jgi:hypothetical protein
MKESSLILQCCLRDYPRDGQKADNRGVLKQWDLPLQQEAEARVAKPRQLPTIMCKNGTIFKQTFLLKHNKYAEKYTNHKFI